LLCDVHSWVVLHRWLSHVKHAAELYLLNEGVHDFGSWWTDWRWCLALCLVHEWVTSHIWMSHVSYTNASIFLEVDELDWRSCLAMCLVHEWFTSHIWTSHVTYIIESRHTSHIWMSHVACVEKLSDILYMNAWIGSEFDWLGWLLCVLCAVYTNELRHTCAWFMSHWWMSYVS